MSEGTLERIRGMCQERLDQQLAMGPLRKSYDLDNYRGGEIEGWRTCLRVLASVPSTHTPAQAIYVFAGVNMDRSSAPKDRSLYDRERGMLDARDHQAWMLAWNRVISRVQGWLEAEYGPAEYEDTKDLPRAALPMIDWEDPEYKRDLRESVAAMLGKEAVR